MWIVWIVVAVAALVGEMLTSGFFLASLAAAALVTAGLALAVPLLAQFVGFGVLSILFLGAVRPAVLRLLPSSGSGQELPRIGPVGQQALAVERIDGRQGMIRIGSGEFWSARPLESGLVIDAGSEVEVVRMEGLTARVRSLDTTAATLPLSEPKEVEEATPAASPAAVAEEPKNPFGLTAREVEVLRLVALGISNQEIADRLFLSPRTVHHHVSHIFNKMGAGNRVEAARMAIEYGLVQPPPQQPAP